ncbi:hypothetical protein TWF569_003993 [Orbilia oligospora]|uniref:Eukaryotic translation initiation factor 3 subunit K n=1 Tax=Orbilia oligospora TaxID=2813651 RepID=A0A7C8JNA5_ORBOL|nr:hypothetical protein TWF102_003813 [Orbilia oligospora]KAF3091197.1 hypothetical protein TWF706_009680 [Orbilia oligospora]KAF3114065.1 hypothetical protein TWF103_001505 [Orbilia oligospora]KAF3129948.1 hypothetical protein TWF703_008482 [Orbilia oligospora]KAF3138748.1 hypothetical protein TWF594_006934 [Orbilia oligospora]
MGSFDHAEERPEHITAILNGLDRYNPETTTIFQEYVAQQCEDSTYDCYANLALLKLYQFNPHLTNSETITNILVKALTAFPSSDFSLCRHLLPPNFLPPIPNATELTEAVQKLTTLNSLLESCNFKEFWNTLDSDDLFADLIADVQGFEDTIRRRITGVDTSDVETRIPGVIDSSMREIERTMLEDWLNLRDEKFEEFVTSVAGYQIDGNTVIISLNKDNEAKPTITRESVKIDQFSRVIRRAYEQPA